MVEKGAETCNQQVDLISMWTLTRPVLPALKSRITRPGALITKIKSLDLEVHSRDDVEAFLALVKIADVRISVQSLVVIITITIITTIIINTIAITILSKG